MRNTERAFLYEFGSMEDTKEWSWDYSSLKFGSNSAAIKFGYQMADKFFATYTSQLMTNRCVVIPSPYNFVPNAAGILARHFTDRLNHNLVSSDGENVDWTIIHRKISYTNDYGFLTKEHRQSLIKNDVFFFNPGFVKNKTIIFVDDVLITGTHEEKMIEIMDNAGLNNTTFFFYLAKYIHGANGADIEAKINFARIRNLNDYLELSQEANHHIIVRPIKFLLSQSSAEFDKAARTFNADTINKLYNGALGEGYYRVPAYQKNFGILRKYYLKMVEIG